MPQQMHSDARSTFLVRLVGESRRSPPNFESICQESMKFNAIDDRQVGKTVK